jgi:hypothetical protein
MVVLISLGLGAAVGMAVAWLSAGEYPSGRSGAASAGAMGGFLSWGLIGSLVVDDPSEFTGSMLVIIVAGAALVTYVLGRLLRVGGSRQARGKGAAGR